MLFLCLPLRSSVKNSNYVPNFPCITIDTAITVVDIIVVVDTVSVA